MKLELQFTKSGRKYKLWHVLVATTALAAVLALLPQRVGVPIAILIEGAAIVALLVCITLLLWQRYRK